MNTENPIVSIIVAAYNASSYICRLLKSIPNSSSLEIIVINDGSTDSTENVVSEMSMSDDRILFINQNNAGVSAARNHGIQKANGKWLMFADADDWYDCNQLAELVGRLECLDESVGVVTFSVSHVFPLQTVAHQAAEFLLSPSEFLKKGLFMEASWNYAFRRELINKYDICFPKGIINTEDQNFNLKVMLASEKIASFDLIVYNYNKSNESSASNKKHKKEWTEGPILSAIDLVEFCTIHHLPIEMVKSNIAHLLYQFFEDHSSDISLWERRRGYRLAYKKICEAIPSFVHYRKYLIPYYTMALGMLLFKIHDFIKK